MTVEAPAAPAAPPPTPVERLRRFDRRRLLLGALEGLLYVAVALLMIWPVTLHLTDRIIGSGDGEFYMWLGWRIAELVQDGQWPLDIPDTLHPYGANLLLGDGTLGYLVVAFWNLVADLYLAFNLAVLTALIANMLAGRRLAAVVVPEARLIQITGAIAFATAPVVALRLYGHVHLLFAFVLALVVAEAVLHVTGRQRLRPGRVGLLLFVAYLVSVYFLIASAVVLVVFAGVAAWRDRQLKDAARRLGIAFAICLVGMSPFIVARAQLERDEANVVKTNNFQQIHNEQNQFLYSSDLLSVVAQPEQATRVDLPGAERLHRDLYPNVLENTSFPGIALLIGVVALVLVSGPLRLPLAISFVAVWVLSLGPSLFVDGEAVLTHEDGTPVRWLPLAALTELPGFTALRAPNRLAFMLSALAMVGLVLGIASLARRLRRPRVVAAGALVGVGLLLPTSLITPPTATLALASNTQEALVRVRETARPGDSVLYVPMDGGNGDVSGAKLQVVHGRPMLGFFAQHSGVPWYSGLEGYKTSRALAVLRCWPPLVGYGGADWPPDLLPDGNELADLRRDFGVRWIIVDRLAVDSEGCAPRKDIINGVLIGATPMAEDARWRIYELPPTEGSGTG